MTKSAENAKLEHVLLAIRKEHEYAISHFPPFRSKHEGYAIIKEELDELWQAIKANKKQNNGQTRKEAVQVATMAVRFLIDLDWGD